MGPSEPEHPTATFPPPSTEKFPARQQSPFSPTGHSATSPEPLDCAPRPLSPFECAQAPGTHSVPSCPRNFPTAGAPPSKKVTLWLSVS